PRRTTRRTSSSSTTASPPSCTTRRPFPTRPASSDTVTPSPDFSRNARRAWWESSAPSVTRRPGSSGPATSTKKWGALTRVGRSGPRSRLDRPAELAGQALARRRPLLAQLGQPLQEGSLLLRPGFRRLHHHRDEQVAPASPAEMWEAAASKPEHRAGLNAGVQVDPLGTLERRDLHLTAQRRLGHRHH